ncbi:hypothetical protein HPP92_015630 [Vanilla planifolia]|uniref:Uncharacterized protein n=1 Tax=Vanilla planifolia TaxID=51239 RepID=A0A835QLK2_VANPL|nr:hypothetical protein HPP92_015630 [Vanilla planifolia]
MVAKARRQTMSAVVQPACAAAWIDNEAATTAIATTNAFTAPKPSPVSKKRQRRGDGRCVAAEMGQLFGVYKAE